jgi:hypothetical protein
VDAVVYIIQETKGGRVIQITPSARVVKQVLTPGLRAEMWVGGQKKATYYARTRDQVGSAADRPPIDFKALMTVEGLKHRLTTQQYKTLKGQVMAGNPAAAMKGIDKLLRKEVPR